ncbi:hypothetical protein ACNOYE_26290 [Nannocystaceae bacterium ST9]
MRSRVAVDEATSAGDVLDALAAEVFSGVRGRARLAPLIERFDVEVGKLDQDDPDFEQLQLVRMDWALCDATIPGAKPGDTWAWRAIHGDVHADMHADVHADMHGERPGTPAPSWSAAARSIAGLFEVFPGEPAWVRDRLSGVVLRLFDSIGPWPHAPVDESAALWELRLVPDDAGGFRIARPPIDYPDDLLRLLERELPKRFGVPAWPTLQDVRRARLRHRRVGGRTPLIRLLRLR